MRKDETFSETTALPLFLTEASKLYLNLHMKSMLDYSNKTPKIKNKIELFLSKTHPAPRIFYP